MTQEITLIGGPAAGDRLSIDPGEDDIRVPRREHGHTVYQEKLSAIDGLIVTDRYVRHRISGQGPDVYFWAHDSLTVQEAMTELISCYKP